MKFNLIIVIAFIFSFNAMAKKIPARINTILVENKTKTKSAIVNLNLLDCRNCSGFFFETLESLYQRYPNSVYCIASSETEKRDLLFFLHKQKIMLDSSAVFVSQELDDYFNKAAKENNYIIQINDGDFFLFGEKNRLDDPLKFFLYLESNQYYTAELKDSLQFKFDFVPTSNNRINLINGNLYVLNVDNNLLAFKHRNSSNFQTLQLDSVLTFGKMFEILKLNAIDSVLTMKNVVQNESFGNKMINISSINECNGKVYLGAFISTEHLLNENERKVMLSVLKKKAKTLKNQKEITVTKNYFFLIEYDWTTKELFCFKSVKVPDNYITNGHSTILINQSQDIATVNMMYATIEKLSNEKFLEKSYVLGNYKLDRTNSELVFQHFEKFHYPDWYGNKDVRINYTNGYFNKVNGVNYFMLKSYPYVINTSSGQVFSLSEKQILEILNQKKFRLATVIFYPVDNNKFNLICFNYITKSFNVFQFDHLGNYIGKFDFPLINISEVYEFNGKLVNVLASLNKGKILIEPLTIKKMNR